MLQGLNHTDISLCLISFQISFLLVFDLQFLLLALTPYLCEFIIRDPFYAYKAGLFCMGESASFFFQLNLSNLKYRYPQNDSRMFPSQGFKVGHFL